METLFTIISCTGMLLFMVAMFFTQELALYIKKGREIPKVLQFNWMRLWFHYTGISLGVYLILKIFI